MKYANWNVPERGAEIPRDGRKILTLEITDWVME